MNTSGFGITYKKVFRGLINIFRWTVPYLRSNIWSIQQEGKRILAVWDFRYVPFTVGDLLYCQVMALIVRDIHKVEKIDIILLCDELNPARADGGMDSRNFHYYFARLISVFFVNQYLGSLIIMDSPGMLSKYIAENCDRYIIFPPYSDKEGRFLEQYHNYFNYALLFYEENHYVPYLSCKNATLMWARHFLAAQSQKRLPIVIQLRNLPTHSYRNAVIDSWLEFVGYCEQHHDVFFVMIGEKEEIDPRFRGFSNVLIAKDYSTTIEQDLALIQTGIMFLGTTSGPATMALFSDKPYVIYGFQTVYEKLEAEQQMPWATPLQKLVWEQETTEKLITDFEWLYNRIDRERWRIEFDRLAGEAAVKLKKTM